MGNKMSVRVRYAPSPTGLQHIGGIRTALFNYYFAKASKGTFILRIEDTDRERFNDESLQDIYATFDWLGIKWDEGPDIGGPYGPYFQSERKEIYTKHILELLKSRSAYRCFCTPERLAELREKQKKEKKNIGYDRHCRELPDEEIQKLLETGTQSVIRLKVPLSGKTGFDDYLLGKIERNNIDINPDPVLIKSDGFPTYHLANVIDDHLMKISHVLRAQEWIPSTALHILLYQAFGWDEPVFCHLPMVMGKDGQKLSKRHGSTSVNEFVNQGYLPEALLNYISLLGWSFDDSKEFFAQQELETLFTLDKLNKAPAVFDYKKLEWFNGMYIRNLVVSALHKKILPDLIKNRIISDPPSEDELSLISKALPIIKERLKFLTDAPQLLSFFFKEIDGYNIDDIIPKKLDREKTLQIAEEVYRALIDFEKRSDEENEETFRTLAESLDTKLGNILMPLRVAITGSKVSPPLFESIRLLGIEKTRSRLEKVIDLLKQK
jgi:glutamyl-tRNA synthetase